MFKSFLQRAKTSNIAFNIIKAGLGLAFWRNILFLRG